MLFCPLSCSIECYAGHLSLNRSSSLTLHAHANQCIEQTMDPLSLTASIIAVLQLTTALTTYLNNIHHATAEQKKITVEACNLYSLLTTLRFRVEDARTDDPWFDQVKLLNVANGPLDQFKQVLDRIMERISPSGKKERIKSALVWQWTKSDIDEALQQMERLKTLVNIALTNDHL